MVLWLITSSAHWPIMVQIMVQMQNQLQLDIKLAQHLCIDWLIAAMGSVCYESHYNVICDHLKQCWFLVGPACICYLTLFPLPLSEDFRMQSFPLSAKGVVRVKEHDRFLSCLAFEKRIVPRGAFQWIPSPSGAILSFSVKNGC